LKSFRSAAPAFLRAKGDLTDVCRIANQLHPESGDAEVVGRAGARSGAANRGYPRIALELLVQCETEGTWGGIYLFETEASARAWEVHALSLLARIGATSVLSQPLLVLADEAQGEPTPVKPASPVFA